ncbi:TonB-dependent receptor plug domain-containing protein [Gayadomonas joobiniege]|uniref:TonB-dependent receptor plug domain-containing protein n=1 Tax=Gayadomonas joobiniege TaxID=1234606 RepID=UPI0003657213|nr:hypothetical protein [Gayadomonas joobiniege]
MTRALPFILPALGYMIPSFYLAAATTSDKKIESITVEASATANQTPVGTFDAPVSNLEYDPRVDLQSRNMAEAQADVTIRGGIFENTGFSVGSATLLDPQTGHYVSELPIAPSMLTSAQIFTGADNALFGVNSSVGTVAFGWTKIRDGGQLSLGAGNNGFNLQSVQAGTLFELKNDNDWQMGLQGEVSHSQSDGSIEFGDHDFKRAAGRVQLLGQNSQTDLFVGVQEKFFGWPNMYTPFNVNETEDLKTHLLMLNHQQTYTDDSHFEISAYYRKHKDHYVFSRENPAVFESFHETQVTSIAVSGHHSIDSQVAINYAGQIIADSIESTSLENNFTSRNYLKLSVLPEYKIQLAQLEQVKVRLGAAFNDTNRDASEFSILGDVQWRTQNRDGTAHTWYLSYAEASQVAGYTAIGGSDTGGLFRSNYELGRESSQNIELGFTLESLNWLLNSAVFFRKDDNLTDWTFNFESTSARFANPVDIDTSGLELLAQKRFEHADIIASYTYLHKSEDYGSEEIDASFYALNYPDHRVTLGVIWQPIEQVEVKLDNEWRQQTENALRSGPDTAFFTHVSINYHVAQVSGLYFTLAGDNIWDEAFQEVPGTPGRGEQYTASLTYQW